MPKIRKDVNDIMISNEQLIFSIDELRESGLTLYKIHQMEDDGILRKLNKKNYENLKFEGEESDFYYANAYVPTGVVCLLSAASYYNLTTYIPDAVDIAIKRKAKVSSLPDYPSIALHYYTNERFALGVSEISDGKNMFRIYDIEKTIVDIIFYRERVGIEETKEILISYLRRKDRNLNTLLKYANMMKCGDVLKKYLEVLI